MASIRTENPVFETIKVLSLDLITIAGKRIDLIEIFLGLQLFESIFENFMSGKVFISDTYDMFKNESLSGNEEIRISFQERATNIQRVYSFRLYKINRDFDITKTSAKSKILECYFYSPEKQVDILNQISRKYSDYPENVVESIVRDIYESHEKTIAAEYTSEVVDYFCDYRQGSAVIDFMTKNAVSAQGEMDYLFFESMAGFHFVPLSYLLAQEPVEELRYLTKREMSFRVDDMQFFQQDAYFDINIDASRGLFGKTLYKLADNDRYGFVKTEATYSDNAANFLTNGRNLLFSSELFSANNKVGPEYHNHDVAQIRSAQMVTLLHNNRLMVRTLGTLDRKVGDILKVEYPNQDNLTEPNTSLDGSWIILSIKHTISNAFEYSQNIMLAKNARNLDDNLPGAAGDIVI
jgi:hypothetical protein